MSAPRDLTAPAGEPQPRRSTRSLLGVVVRRGGIRALALVLWASLLGSILGFFPRSRLSRLIRARYQVPDRRRPDAEEADAPPVPGGPTRSGPLRGD